MPITRELSISYNGVTVGKGSDNYLIDGPFKWQTSYTQGRIEFTLVVVGSSESDFQSKCSSLESAFRRQWQPITLSFNNTTHYSYSPTSNTGFNTVPNLIKLGSEYDTGRSRQYICSFDFELPADSNGFNGRRSSNVVLQYTPSMRRRVLITATYTALSSNNARTQFEASIGAYASSVLSAIDSTATWEGPFDQQESADDQNKIINISRRYEELIFDQQQGTRDDTQLRDVNFSINDLSEYPGDSVQLGQVFRLQKISASYSASIDKTLTTNLTSVYESKIKPWVVQSIKNITGGSSVAITSYSPTYDQHENRINCYIMAIVVSNGNVVSCRITTDDSIDDAQELLGVWAKDRIAKERFTGIGSYTRTVTMITTSRGIAQDSAPWESSGNSSSGSDLINGPPNTSGPGGGQFSSSSEYDLSTIGGIPDPIISQDGGILKKVLKGVNRSTHPFVIGKPGEDQIQLVDRVMVVRFEYYVEVDPNSGSRTSTGSSSDPQSNTPIATGG